MSLSTEQGTRAAGAGPGAALSRAAGDAGPAAPVRIVHVGFGQFLPCPSMEPHLGSAHHLGGFSRPENFIRATEAFTGILQDQGIDYA